MKYNNPMMVDNFLDFMEKGYHKINGKTHSMSAMITIFKRLIKYFELNAKSYELEEDLVSPALKELDIVKIDAGSFKANEYFKNINLCIICPLVNESIFIRTIKDENTDDIKYVIEVYEAIICSNVIINLCFNSPSEGVYTKDILFIRSTGREDGTPIFIYKEDRFHIYNSNLIDMNFDDIALDRKVCYSYLASAIKSLNKEIFDNINEFFLVDSNEIK